MRATEFPPVVYVDVYRSEITRWRPFRNQLWRWRARNANNWKVMANSAEAYTNRQDCLDAIAQLFGSGTNVYLRESEQGNVALRMAT